MHRSISLIPIVLFLANCAVATGYELRSPDGNVLVTVGLVDRDGRRGMPVYSISYRGRAVLAESRLGLELAAGSLAVDLHVESHSAHQHDETWRPVCGERETVRDHYRELELDLRTDATPTRRMRLAFRAYNEGVAFNYTLPAQDGLGDFTITAERTSFRFTGDHTTWAVYHAQGNYDGSETRLSGVRAGVERPLTVRVADDLYAAITEARLVDYARMKLRPVEGEAHTLEAFLDAERGVNGHVTGKTPFTTPWRVVMLADSPGRLLERNYLILNLNDPCALADTTWIRPGKVIRESTLTTAGGKACVDFCAARGLQYVEFDAGWYGPESDPHSDARHVNTARKGHSDPHALDVQTVIDYGRSQGIGVILYVNQIALSRQLDEIFPLYEKWGVRGVKFGFVNVGSQHWTRWLHEAIRKAAAHHLMVDIHDEFRNMGYQRTYPNLMTVEGIGGNEEFPTPVHNATLPFTRFLTGPADYTFCWYSGRLRPTHAHQLAISTIYFSPWQFLYWYDRPSQYRGEAALDYWKELPTTWDETRVIRGEIGKFVSVARRKGNVWYVGTICLQGGPLEIPLAFLEADTKYRATIYDDQEPAGPQSKVVRIEKRTVDATTVLRLNLSSYGGQAMRIVPQEEKPFVHPGLLHSRAALARMKERVAADAEPWRSGFQQLRRRPESQADWRLRGPVGVVTRPGNVGAFDVDANAAYQNALMWAITGREAHARKAVEILNAWSAALRDVTGPDRQLGAALGGFKFVNAAEIMRSTYPAWHTADVARCQRMLHSAIYPVIKDFATFANGNWDTACIKTVMAIGVFCDDRSIWNRGVEYFEHGSGNGRLTHYIINATGQCQESGRDQSHAQLGLGHLAEACEMAWTQGIDLYATADNRLREGFEYTARYNLGDEVPFTPYRDTTGTYFARHISSECRGRWRPIFEMVWNHYENRRGIPAPFTRKAAELLRPEGAAFDADHPGFGTLLFTLARMPR
jgi:alpha-glucosidase